MKKNIISEMAELNAKVLDKTDDNMYELLVLDTGDRKRPYLKMRNPSIGTYHIEGVGRECKTVAEALAFRMKRVTDKSIVVSETGRDWYQQDDVIVYPKGARVLKPTPIILT